MVAICEDAVPFLSNHPSFKIFKYNFFSHGSGKSPTVANIFHQHSYHDLWILRRGVAHKPGMVLTC